MWFRNDYDLFGVFFQDGGQHLVVVDESNEHILSVWDVGRDKPVKLADTKVTGGKKMKKYVETSFIFIWF